MGAEKARRTKGEVKEWKPGQKREEKEGGEWTER